jgi:hypothetical protein
MVDVRSKLYATTDFNVSEDLEYKGKGGLFNPLEGVYFMLVMKQLR